MKREEYLPFARPDIDGDEFNEIREALEAGWVTSGPKTGHGKARNLAEFVQRDL